jgi:hypothetical protein
MGNKVHFHQSIFLASDSEQQLPHPTQAGQL